MSGSHRRSRTGTRLLFLGALLLGAMLMVSCGGDGPGAPTGATLEQATYLTENSREGTATLEDGEFREPVAEGSASELVIRLGKWTTGHIDGRDGVDAAAVTRPHRLYEAEAPRRPGMIAGHGISRRNTASLPHTPDACRDDLKAAAEPAGARDAEPAPGHRGRNRPVRAEDSKLVKRLAQNRNDIGRRND